MTNDRHILIKNIYYMLSYAFTVLNQSLDEKVDKEAFENIHNLFAAILSKGLGRQLKQGLYREYISVTDTMPLMRGKINLPGTMRGRIARRQALTCDYDELSVNNIFNQILKTTALLLMRNDKTDPVYRDDLKKCLLFFSDVDSADPASVRWSALRFQRNNQSYRMLLGICQLILEGMLLTTAQGEYRLASFLDEQRMSRLYEKFILEYYRKHYPQLHASASQIHWMLDDDESAMLPVMQSDITLSRENDVLIIDAKYYSRTTQTQYDAQTLHSNNLYQIFTYVKNKEAGLANVPHKKVAGMLLYARTDEAIQPDHTYSMSGNRISVKTLDLNCDFEGIRKQLDSVIQKHLPCPAL